jgi:Winged helix DNA-binding domain
VRPPDIARRRLVASRLIGSAAAFPDEVVWHHLAMQAQDYGPAKWSIGQRARGLVDGDVDDAVASGAIVRTHVLRPTWHFVARDDLRWLLALSGPRVQQGNAGRYRQLGLDEMTLAAAADAIATALKGDRHLTRGELAEVLDDAGIDHHGQRMPHILMHCELEAVICSGARSGKQHAYALVDERVPAGGRFDRREAVVELTRRYLESHGPATVKDISWWSGLTMTDIRLALADLGADVRSDALDGLTLWSMAADEGPAPRTRRAYFLQTYDELVVGYTESRFVGDPGIERARAAYGATYPTGGLLLGDRIGGHWRRTFEREGVRVEVQLYAQPTPRDTKALENAARELGRFLAVPASLDLTIAP